MTESILLDDLGDQSPVKSRRFDEPLKSWIPAFAGMTDRNGVEVS